MAQDPHVGQSVCHFASHTQQTTNTFPPRALTLWRSVLMNVPDRPQVATPFICFSVAAIKWQLTAPIHDKVALSDRTFRQNVLKTKVNYETTIFLVLYCDKQMYNHFTNYHTPTRVI